MRHWRLLLLLLLITLLPLQLVAGQFAPCPHEHDTTGHAHHDHHHDHHHDNHHGVHHATPSGYDADWHQNLCPDCDVIVEVGASSTEQFHCDHCHCCHLAISPAVPSTTQARAIRQPNHWLDSLTIPNYSRSIAPGLRPPLFLA